MTRQSALDRLAAEMPELRRLFEVRDLAIFGSVARDETREGSDLDVLVTFEDHPTFGDLVALSDHLENLCGIKVDLATRDALRPELRPQIEREAVDVSTRTRCVSVADEGAAVARNRQIYITDIQDACRKVLRFTAGLSREGFLGSEIVYDAVLRNIEILGEAAKNVPEEIRAASPGVPWREITGMRDRLAHGYSGSTTT